MLGEFGRTRQTAQEKFRLFVQEGKNQPSPWEQLKNQIFLGSDDFVEASQCQMNPEQSLEGIPKPQKLAPVQPLEHYAKTYSDRNTAMAMAYKSGHYSLQAVGKYFGVSYATVGRAINNLEKRADN